ncbi:peptidyl-prolyl cis-trans isomerase [Bacillus sp. FJAT-27251]|uniref:peptidyl-prolyl cis-trans isomerase n=1 Tax=Bacillus sp. FJAT-27251 TaxID=1684142 RepID=UPI0006A75F9F|nr:peptidyl-prolyl cis-trans isomerase [Bacillus sp. FJAT-27251]
MGKRQLLMAVVALVILNVLTLSFFLSRPDYRAGKETVATVGKEEITRQEWLGEMEARYGEETLRNLVDQKVIEKMADKYKIKVSDTDVEQELTMYKVLYGPQGQNFDDEQWQKQVKLGLMLEELLTKDAVFSEEELEEYYRQNMSLFEIPAAYRLSQIIVKSEEEAQQTIKELEEGSSFSALAMERSLDEFSANQGGELGFVSEESERVEPEVLAEVRGMKEQSWSRPIKLETGYGIVYLHEKVEGKKYAFSEVKDRVRRQMAVEQMDLPVSARNFWSEAEVSWFYGK